MTDTENNNPSSEDRTSEAEWANRRLCPDGNCIGVIGPDGRCKECGRPAGEDLPFSPDAGSDSLPDDDNEPDDRQADATPSGNRGAADPEEWANRRLCPDGNCIGVIGPDGRCKECGRQDEGF
ncbi:MAG: hypothetical protein JJV98_07940 [Desulfosarcina sp.]|nr:hypothetical protein [Desulfobacterales bacterium]